MEGSSSENVDIESQNGEWIDVSQENIDRENVVQNNGEKYKDAETRKPVIIVDERRDLPSSKTSDKATSTLSLQSDIIIPNKQKEKDSLRFWDRWLKVIVFIGAVISITTLVVILVAESEKVFPNCCTFLFSLLVMGHYKTALQNYTNFFHVFKTGRTQQTRPA